MVFINENIRIRGGGETLISGGEVILRCGGGVMSPIGGGVTVSIIKKRYINAHW